jgi:acetolactate synthase-1/2/3 large subunit
MRRPGANGFGEKANEMVDMTRPEIDWVRLAESMTVPAARADTLGEFAALFAVAMRERGPRLIAANLP